MNITPWVSCRCALCPALLGACASALNLNTHRIPSISQVMGNNNIFSACYTAYRLYIYLKFVSDFQMLVCALLYVMLCTC